MLHAWDPWSWGWAQPYEKHLAMQGERSIRWAGVSPPTPYLRPPPRDRHALYIKANQMEGGLWWMQPFDEVMHPEYEAMWRLWRKVTRVKTGVSVRNGVPLQGFLSTFIDASPPSRDWCDQSGRERRTRSRMWPGFTAWAATNVSKYGLIFSREVTSRFLIHVELLCIGVQACMDEKCLIDNV